MKLKMAKNSLFAILLRTRWWVSVLIGALLALVALAVLPLELRVVGALSGLPFLVIGAIAARAQWHRPSEARLAETLQAVSTMAWPAFAARLEQAFVRDGYTVARGSSAAFDFELQKQGRLMLVSARRWKAARTGLEGLRALQAARAGTGAADALYIGLGDLTDGARDFAAEHRIAVWRGPELALALQARPGRSPAPGALKA